MRRSYSASSDLGPESALSNVKAKEASKSTGNLKHYGRKQSFPDPEETSSLRNFHSTPGEMLSSGTKPQSQRNRRVSEGDVDPEPQGPTYYLDITLEREQNESFGFVIFSSVHKSGSTIGKEKRIRGLVTKETVVLRRSGVETNIWFITKGKLTAVKRFISSNVSPLSERIRTPFQWNIFATAIFCKFNGQCLHNILSLKFVLSFQ